ncbi:hypothetical protein [Aureimonas leprariae]|uniref:Uncharacterized protein n=1 Tax=Plantimonas leprariae TaxID=2615207 RepID=A0A7V7PR23_9HYPH|nr:hypothetical protein [Aureimonas leprariae]KAB0680916.1 hypothetical protein F6X38_08015 [Aureimonas leprariae]
MVRGKTVDHELSALIRDVIAAELLAPNSVELRTAETVAQRGLAALDDGGRRVWETRLLPILSKPLGEQIAIASIIRRGGYVPRKIDF